MFYNFLDAKLKKNQSKYGGFMTNYKDFEI
jgi:hypothetical protein